jgi:hypothetical protein
MALECGGKSDATPPLRARRARPFDVHGPVRKRRRRFALPAQSKSLVAACRAALCDRIIRPKVGAALLNRPASQSIQQFNYSTLQPFTTT